VALSCGNCSRRDGGESRSQLPRISLPEPQFIDVAAQRGFRSRRRHYHSWITHLIEMAGAFAAIAVPTTTGGFAGLTAARKNGTLLGFRRK